jgi:hypothetical protein
MTELLCGNVCFLYGGWFVMSTKAIICSLIFFPLIWMLIYIPDWR